MRTDAPELSECPQPSTREDHRECLPKTGQAVGLIPAPNPNIRLPDTSGMEMPYGSTTFSPVIQSAGIPSTT